MQRLIARLDIKNGSVIKGIHLEGQRRIGDPVALATAYYEAGIDEILLMDSVASLYGRSNLFHTISEACRSVFVPITMGGGIRTIEDVELALASGADKVAVNTGIVQNPDLARAISSTYGAQCLVGSIEAKRRGDRWEAYVANGREPTGRDVVEWAQELQSLGAGEILLTSVDCEGTQRGFDLPLYEAVTEAVEIPVVASGGAGSIQHVEALDRRANLQGIALAALLHYKKATVADIKASLPKSRQRGRIDRDRSHRL